jgi:eukaryotic-like serine/threonine-protein kinase
VADVDRWTTLERIYHEAVERPIAERARFLERACAGDDALRHELESLLANEGPSLLDKSALDVAAREMAQQVTSSWVGRTIRNYDVLALVGVGGMGEVYRARDSVLGREVALKLLPVEVSNDRERLKRLEREARMLAALNHPNIATLYGLEQHDNQRFLVMELVPGQTLAARLRRGALPMPEALEICRQIADGLEAAHDAGIIHRDLKPANITITPDGRVKLLDFGLAKALDTHERGVDPTVAVSEATREGAVLGTPAYMSPEQARGKPVDRRTDIWAFGCVLYECLSGRRPFTGDTVTDTLAAVLDKEPDWGALGDHVPASATRLLRRCLAKDVRRRLQHIGDARLDLEETGAETGHRPARDRPMFRAVPALVIAAILIATSAGVAFWLGARRATTIGERAVTRLTLTLDDKTNGDLTLPLQGWDRPFAISPDGQRIVLRARGGGRSQLFLRELSGFETRPLPGTDAARTPFFSPDGQWIGFWRAEDRILRKVSVAGGSPIELAPTDVPPAAVWGTDDEIVIQTDYPRGELLSIPAGGGKPKPIAVADRSNGESISLRGRVPGGNDLLVASFGLGEAWLDMLSRETGKRRHIVRGGNLPASYTRTGHLVYSDADTLLAVPLNQRLEPVGKPVPVLTGIDHYFRHSNVALSDNGTLIYIPADRVEESQLVWEDREGGVTPIPGGRAPMTWAALSPDGREAAVNLVEGTKLQVWVVDLERGARRLLVRSGESVQPLWSRDGKFVTYVSIHGDEQAIYRTRADGTGAEESLVRVTRWTTPLDWSPNGRTLLYSEYTKRGDSDIWSYSGGKATPLLAGPFSEESASFSPDGRFIAFAADDGGASHVYIQAFPGPGPRVAVSIDEGGSPRWGLDGRQIFYEGSRRRMVVDVTTDPVVRLGTPRPLSERRDLVGKMPESPDGHRFLSLTTRAQKGRLELRVVLNWFDELQRLAPHPH